jgi:hypothetical protein
VLNDVEPLPVHKVARRTDTHWHHVRVRSIERGELNDPFAVRRVWTWRERQTEPVEEWLVIRREAKNRYNYSLSNAPVDTSIERLAWLKCQRYFVERANQDAKSEAGWDELVARKYRGWEHHLALVVLAVWFAALTKWEWACEIIRDPALGPTACCPSAASTLDGQHPPAVACCWSLAAAHTRAGNRTRRRAFRQSHSFACQSAEAPKTGDRTGLCTTIMCHCQINLTLNYLRVPFPYKRLIRTTNLLERFFREFRSRADEIGCFGSQAQAETLFYLILQREKAKHAVA